uniref:Uncharacterized protein n=1 Tax=Anguilla anguilla TaxID=7936 RepID=A0A0E9R9Y8_ANGAN
MYPSCTYTL